MTTDILDFLQVFLPYAFIYAGGLLTAIAIKPVWKDTQVMSLKDQLKEADETIVFLSQEKADLQDEKAELENAASSLGRQLEEADNVIRDFEKHQEKFGVYHGTL